MSKIKSLQLQMFVKVSYEFVMLICDRSEIDVYSNHKMESTGIPFS